MITARCSSLPLLAACSQAQHPPVTRIDGDDYLARLGSAFHALMAAAIRAETANIDAQAAEWNVKQNDLVTLYFSGKRMWDETLCDLFPNPVVEDYFEVDTRDFKLTGHADLISYLPELRQVRGGDWKSGYLDLDATEQMRGYARCALDRWPEAESVQMSIIRIRDQRMDTLPVWTRQELDDWFTWMAVRLGDETYRPGDHCGRCPLALECPAHCQSIRSMVLASKSEMAAIEEMTPDNLADAVLAYKSLGKWLTKAVDAARAFVEAQGGQYGDRLKIIEKPRRSFDLVRGMDVLESRLGTQGVLAAATISKTAIEDAVKAAVPRGKGAGAIREIMGALAEAGAIETSLSRSLEVKHRGHSSPAITNGDNDDAIEAG